MKDKVKEAARLKTHVIDPKNHEEIRHVIHNLVADPEERQKLMKSTPAQQVAALKKNGYKFSK